MKLKLKSKMESGTSYSHDDDSCHRIYFVSIPEFVSVTSIIISRGGLFSCFSVSLLRYAKHTPQLLRFRPSNGWIIFQVSGKLYKTFLFSHFLFILEGSCLSELFRRIFKPRLLRL